MSSRILHGDALAVLRTLAPESVYCCVTSPPYWGLRDYGIAGQLGLERTPEEFVARLVSILQEVRRVLRDDGTMWLNLGDSYTSGGRKERDPGQSKIHPAFEGEAYADDLRPDTPAGLKPKDLVGIPWRVAFALQADGWYLRSDIIWAKPAPMPESVTDRPTRSHEYIFLLAKSERYYCDMESIKEPAVGFSDHDLSGPGYSAPGQTPQNGNRRTGNAKTFRGGGAYTRGRSFDNSATVERESHGNAPNESGLRNKRDVWTVNTKPFLEAHFATFPEDLIRPCILAGCPEGGTVLDPFSGAGTTGLVAAKTGRNYIGIELNPDYVEMSTRRLDEYAPLFRRNGTE